MASSNNNNSLNGAVIDKCGFCGKSNLDLQKCTGCKSVVYCSREHQKKDWRAHKAMCKFLRNGGNDLNMSCKEGEFVGTFRWSSQKCMPSLPKQECLDLIPLVGWMKYFSRRGDAKLVALAQSEPALVDGLSYPLTLAFALHVCLFFFFFFFFFFCAVVNFFILEII